MNYEGQERPFQKKLIPSTPSASALIQSTASSRNALRSSQFENSFEWLRNIIKLGFGNVQFSDQSVYCNSNHTTYQFQHWNQNENRRRPLVHMLFRNPGKQFEIRIPFIHPPQPHFTLFAAHCTVMHRSLKKVRINFKLQNCPDICSKWPKNTTEDWTRSSFVTTLKCKVSLQRL